jgi:hypothetical protein
MRRTDYMRRPNVIELWGVSGFVIVLTTLLYAALFIDD